MGHPLASELASVIDHDVEELHTIVASWVVRETSEQERARYRRFGAGLRRLKDRIAARAVRPTDEEVEIALLALLALAGHQGIDARP